MIRKKTHDEAVIKFSILHNEYKNNKLNNVQLAITRAAGSRDAARVGIEEINLPLETLNTWRRVRVD